MFSATLPIALEYYINSNIKILTNSLNLNEREYYNSSKPIIKEVCLGIYIFFYQQIDTILF